ncbi:hypothetical protein [Halobacillus trueperi]|uniref:Uncharacterized protein n=1 Tax=Halobacillus trueperi TaxID=156205 RepID=A0A3E0IXM8_9BACI|nr:hypothetical protein [Halobacillus trueperi]REJ05388.1 hypothetical protein DYE48_20375 [Halobacillus trueperi]
MAELVRKRNTFWNWKYAVMLLLIPFGFYLVSLKEQIGFLQHIFFVGIIVWLAFVGVFGITNRYERLKMYGFLYLSSSLLFAYLGLVFIW